MTIVFGNAVVVLLVGLYAPCYSGTFVPNAAGKVRPRDGSHGVTRSLYTNNYLETISTISLTEVNGEPGTAIPVVEAPVPKSDSATTVKEEDADVVERRLELLDEAILEFNSSAANLLLFQLRELRDRKDGDMASAAFLDQLLEQGPDRKLPVWSRVIRPMARFSQRARLASLSRVLDHTTPPPAAEDFNAKKDGNNEESLSDKQRRRRRALVSLLRTLSTGDVDEETYTSGPAIRWLEKKARRESRLRTGPDDDMTARRPADLETPSYTVVAKRSSSFEIRHYEPFSVCSVSMSKPRPVDAYKTDATVSDPKTGGSSAFGALAGYLFGKNEQGEAMKMTTPVLTRNQSSGDGDRLMSFVLPSNYWGRQISLAPKPLSGSGVSLQFEDGGHRAVVMFGGFASRKNVEKCKQQLLDELSKENEWQVQEDEPITLAQYNDPFTPPWKRLNEVSVRVRAL